MSGYYIEFNFILGHSRKVDDISIARFYVVS